MRPAATVMTKIALAGIGLPVILVLLCYLSLSSGGADHNRAAVHLAFDGGDIPKGMSSDYLEYIRQMQRSFEELDVVLDHLDEMAEEGKIDRYLVKSVFYALYFGADRIWLSTERYMQFADCFVNYEERTKTVYHEDETTTQETYTVVIPITEKTEIFQKLAQNYGRMATYEQQSNAMNIWYIARYDRQAPMEGDEFSGWGSWNAAGNIKTCDLSVNETAGEIVRLAMSRLGDPYSQELRGLGEYVDCSYLTLWCYRQIGISLPGTAAEQARYLEEHCLTVAKESLQPGDLVFWSYKPNGRYRNITHVRQLITYIPQRSYLFEGTIRENIVVGGIGRERVTEEEMIDAAKMAYADEFISMLPEGYDTMLSAGGNNLSVGQRQRIAIARAFLKNSPIILMDEPSSALDIISERKINQALEELMKNRVVIMVSHRKESFDKFDYVMNL